MMVLGNNRHPNISICQHISAKFKDGELNQNIPQISRAGIQTFFRLNCFKNMQSGETSFIAAQLMTETSQASLLAGENHDSAKPTPLELLFLSWDQFVNELEFE